MSADDAARLFTLAECNPFLRLSYFEFYALGGFISKYPTTLTSLKRPIGFAQPLCNQHFFRNADYISPARWSVLFDEYMKTLNEHNFGVYDLFWWLPNINEAVQSSKSLWNYISNASIEPGEVTEHHQVVTITNKLDPAFAVLAYFKNAPLPQEAIDVVPFFVSQKAIYTALGYKNAPLPQEAIDVVPFFVSQKAIYTALGYKKESPRVPVFTGDGACLRVLTTGIYGHVIFGEHLLPEEKIAMNKARDLFIEKHSAITMSTHSMVAAMRTLTEEAGFNATTECIYTYVRFDQTLMSDTCRDDRYGVLLDKNGDFAYGYPRISSAHTLYCIYMCDPPTEAQPTDYKECSKPTILPLDVVKKNFWVGGKYNPAFPAHVQQMEDCIKYAVEEVVDF